jgi:hypothetical protein
MLLFLFIVSWIWVITLIMAAVSIHPKKLDHSLLSSLLTINCIAYMIWYLVR